MKGGRLALLAAAAVGLWLACAPIDAAPFIAGQYLPALDCVTPGEIIDVVAGYPNDASCDAVCIIPPYDAGVYVTGECAPFPPGDAVNPDSGLCVKALKAINRHDLCLDGGPSNPATDTGAPDTGATPDGGHDTGHDAGVASDTGAPYDGGHE